MQNEKKQLVDLYLPQKCAATGRLITAKDHASVSFSVCDVDAEGLLLPSAHRLSLCGFVRQRGQADDQVNRLCTQQGYLCNVWTYAQ